MANGVARPDVFRYADYRAFLLSYVQDAKHLNPNWTFGIWSRKLGLKDMSSITKIIQGSRDPGPEISQKLVAYFEFNQEERSYFLDLIRLHKIKSDPRLSALLLEKMGKSHPGGAALKLLDQNAFRVISNWYCLAIREMARLNEFFEDPEWIKNQLVFEVTSKEVQTAIQLLTQLGLLKRNDNGLLEIENARLHIESEFGNEAIRRYHESMLEHAQAALEVIPPWGREFSSSTFAMNAEKIPLAKEMIRDFKSKFCKLLEEDRADGVFQVQIQFFPLTKVKVKTPEELE